MQTTTALLIVDVQNGIIDDPDYPIFEASKLLKNIRSLIDKAHAKDIPVIYIQHTEGDDYVLGKGKPGWFIHPDITPSDKDKIILKTTPDAFHNTELQDLLTRLKVERLVVAGLQSEYCIDTTCRRAFSLGYKTILVSDAHSTADSATLTAAQIIGHHNQVLSSWFVSLSDSAEIQF
ncbi:MAG: cysteine hydrolase family protein [Erysipelotrichaceae bacterium]